MSLSLVDSVRSCAKRSAAVAVGLCAVFASGEAGAALPVTSPAPAFHVDASATASLVTELGVDGTNYVTRWNDASGGSRYATSDAGFRPWIAYEKGLPFIDFGPGRYAQREPSGYAKTGFLKWSSKDEAIREVFLVYSDYPGKSGSFLLSCSGNNYHFHRGGKALFNTTYGASALVNGRIEVDGEKVTASYELPEGFHIIHLRTQNNTAVPADRFASDRDNYQQGAQRLREVIVYDSQLTDAQAGDIYAYLTSKWSLSPDQFDVEGTPENYGTVTPAYGTTRGVAAGATFTCTAPEAWTNDARTIAAVCTGWKLYDPMEVETNAGSTASFDYTHPDPGEYRRLVWQWQRFYRVNATVVGAGGSVNAAEQWIRDGEEATVSVVAAPGYKFLKLSCSLLPKDVTETSVTLTVTQPMDFKAYFYPTEPSSTPKTWVGASGESKPTGVAPALPSFCELEYVKSTGSQIVDTKIVPGATTKVEMNFGQVTYAQATTFFGQNWAGSQYLFNMQSSSFYWHGGGNNFGVTPKADTDYTITVGTDGKLVLSSGGTVLKTVTGVSLATTVGRNLAVFGCIDKTHCSSFALYSMKIWQGGSLVRDFVPAKKGDAGCLYDKVSGTLFASEGTGSLTAGPSKEGAETALWVGGEPAGYGPAESYGKMSQAAGTTETYAVPEEVLVDATFKALCAGWELRRMNVDTGLMEKVDEGDGTSATVTLDDPLSLTHLVWKWQLKVKGEDGTYTDWQPGDGLVWDGPSNWKPYGVPSAADRVDFGSADKVYIPHTAVCRSLYVGPNTTLYLGGTNAVDKPSLYDATDLSDRTLTVVDDLVIAGKAAFGARYAQPETRVTVGRDMVVTNAAAVNVFAGLVQANPDARTWRDYKKGGASFTIGRDLVVTNTAKVKVWCHKTSGMPVVWNVASNVTIGVDTRFDGSNYTSDSNCYGWGWEAPNGLGYKVSGNTVYGGSYGGSGGNGNDKTYGFANAPFYPGSPGSYREDERGQGGGAVRIAAGGTIRLDGKIYVTGGHNENMSNNGGSGGGVWFTCCDFVAGPTALINARGGRTNQHGSAFAGGGGRVAIMTGAPSETQVDQLYETGVCDDMLVVASDMNDELLSPWPTLVNVKGGEMGELVSNPSAGSHGKPGTSVYLQNAAGKCIVTVTGNRDTTETVPAYGQSTVEKGSMTFRAPTAFSVVAGQTRVPCLGYTWENVKGASGSGSTTEFTIDITCDTTVTWLWGTTQHRLTLMSGGMGTISWDGNEWYVEGTVVPLTAVPTSGRTFDQWVGSFSYAGGVNKAASLTLTMDRPRETIALFKGAAARTVTWTGAVDSDWFNPANWDADAIPTAADAAVVPSGTVQVRYPSDIAVGSLELSNAATLYVAAKTSVSAQSGTYENQRAAIYRTWSILGDDNRAYTFTVAGDYTQGGTSKVYFGGEITSNRIEVTVGGNMTISGGNSKDRARFQLYASNAEELEEIERYRTGGAKLTVGGDLAVDGYADFTPVAHRYTGASVPVKARNVTIGANAIVDADMRGYGRKWENPGTGWSSWIYGPGAYYCGKSSGSGESNARAGGTYGGKGTANPILECGYLAAPFYAGSAARSANEYTGDIHSGGGAVRIHAAQDFTLNGKIYADGLGRYQVSGGSGGGVWLTCRKFHLGSAAYISVRGGRSCGYGGNGGGAGGRIAIGIRLSDEQIDTLYEEGTLRHVRTTNLEEIVPDSETAAGRRAYARFHNDWTGRIRMTGECGYNGTTGVDAKEGDVYRGGKGTAVLVEPPAPGLLLLVK